MASEEFAAIQQRTQRACAATSPRAGIFTSARATPACATADQSSPDHQSLLAGGLACGGDRGLAPCLCGHSAADHARGGCLVVLGVDYGVMARSPWVHAEFCACSRFRAAALAPMPLESLSHAYALIVGAAWCAAWTMERTK